MQVTTTLNPGQIWGCWPEDAAPWTVINYNQILLHLQNHNGANLTFKKLPPTTTINENCAVSKAPGKEEKARF